MAKGFDKSIAKKKTRKYGVLNKDLKSMTDVLETLTSCEYGKDFILDSRTGEIYGKSKFIRNVQTLQKNYQDVEKIFESEEELEEELDRLEEISDEDINEELDEEPDISIKDLLRIITERTQLVDDIEEGKAAFFFTEALVFKAYKLLHNGNEPTIENSLCVYPDELNTLLDQKMDEMLKAHDFIEKQDDFIDEVMSEFTRFLKKHNYYI